MGGITGEALEAKFKKLEDNIPSLVAQSRGQNLAEDPREGDRVWVPRLSGEAIVESVSGKGLDKVGKPDSGTWTK